MAINITYPAGTTISNVETSDPTSAQQPATKNYVDTTLSTFTQDPSTVFFFSDDFAGSNLDAFWTVAFNGTGSNAIQTPTNITNAHPGLVSLITGTTTTGRGQIAGFPNGLGGMAIGAGVTIFETVIKTPSALSDGTDTYICYFGLADEFTSAGTPATNFIGIIYDSTTSANWIKSTKKAGSTNNVASSTAVGNSAWVKLRAVVNAAGDSVEFFVDGSSIGTLNTAASIPATTTRLGPMISIQKSAGTNDRRMEVDYIASKITFTTPR